MVKAAEAPAGTGCQCAVAGRKHHCRFPGSRSSATAVLAIWAAMTRAGAGSVAPPAPFPLSQRTAPGSAVRW
ncbi:hypothetical protein GCM10009731_40840 [Streptomyces globosus]